MAWWGRGETIIKADSFSSGGAAVSDCASVVGGNVGAFASRLGLAPDFDTLITFEQAAHGW